VFNLVNQVCLWNLNPTFELDSLLYTTHRYPLVADRCFTQTTSPTVPETELIPENQ
jgi:hypothetical protein